MKAKKHPGESLDLSDHGARPVGALPSPRQALEVYGLASTSGGYLSSGKLTMTWTEKLESAMLLLAPEFLFMTDFEALLRKQAQQILKALKHLEYSYQKTKNLPIDIESLSTEQLESWEGLASRFSRVSDLFLSKYLRTFVLKDDPGFRGSFRDFLDQAEKLRLIDNSLLWLSIRELRNRSAHEYAEEKLSPLFRALRQETPILLALKDQLHS